MGMRSKSPAVMDAIRTFVDNYYRENHVPPSLREIALGVGVSKATTYRYLVAMNQHGTLSYDGKTITTKQMGKCATKYFSAPVVGSIRCGDPECEEEFVEEYVSLPTSLFGEGTSIFSGLLGIPWWTPVSRKGTFWSSESRKRQKLVTWWSLWTKTEKTP